MNQFSAIRVEPQRVRLTVEDVAGLQARGAFADYGKVELIDGELLFVNAQFRPHMYAKDELAYRLRRAIDDLGIALFVGTGVSVQLSRTDLPQPDITLTGEPRGEGPVPGASVRLIVEVSDTTIDYDLKRKAAIYAAGGIGEYWVVDVNARVIHRLNGPRQARFDDIDVIPYGTPVASVTISGLIVATDGL